MYRVCLFLSLVLAVSATPDRANYGNYDAPVPSNNINQGSNQDEVPAPKEAGNARWDSDEGTAFANEPYYPSANAQSYSNYGEFPVSNFNQYPSSVGFGVGNLITTGISVIVGLFLLTFVFAGASKLFKLLPNFATTTGRSIDADTVSEVAKHIFDAYNKFNHQE